jgi:hypothetical protein
LSRMSKKFKRVMKKLFGGKSKVGMMDTLFQSSSSATSRRGNILSHIDSTLVGRRISFHIVEVTLIFS